MMDTKKLRQKILDLAIRGKLVPQDPNDEPASVLIEKIRAEKEQLIKEKKIKRDKNESYIYRSDKSYYEQFADGTVKCIDEEIPFEIPESWGWERIGNIAFVTKLAGFEYTKHFTKGNISSNKEIPLVRAQNVKMGKYIENQQEAINLKLSEELNRCALYKECLLMTFIGAGIGDVCIFPNNKRSHLAPNVAKIEFYSDISLEYTLTYLMSSFGQSGIEDIRKSTAQPSLSMATIRTILIPIPPQKEQQQIAKKSDDLLEVIIDVDRNKDEISDYIKQTKSKILDLAIQGKLAPQDPNDEPASVLLERIKSEHSDSKKKAKNTGDNSHYTDTFDIPNNWVVTTMQEVCYLSDGEKIEGKALPYLDVKYLRGKSEPKIVSSGRFVERNNFMILVDGENSGEIFSVTEDGYQGSTFKILNISEQVNEAFIFKLLQNEQTTFKESKVGSAIPHLNKKLFRELYVFLPPLSEQKRIVKKIEEIFASLDEIANSIIA